MRPALSKRAVRAAVLASLRDQGFEIHNGRVISPGTLDKSGIRALNEVAVSRSVEMARRNLVRHEGRLIGYLADGSILDPERIEPRLIQVHPESEEELLFRWARLHWSVPTAAGYGRRLRLLVTDAHNEKLIGLIGLGDGVFSLPARDEWVGWDRERRRTALRGIMHAHVLGAVPPYSHLLGGKLVALLTASLDTREVFAARYAGRETVVSGDRQDGQLALITTTGALGRSSVYNRLRYRRTPEEAGRLVFQRVGLTQGTAQAQFGDDLYAMLKAYAIENCTISMKPISWGRGFRSRREVIDKALAHLGLDTKALAYGVDREVWCAPLGTNAAAFLRGDANKLEPYEDRVEELAAFWRDRWLLGRATNDHRYRSFAPESWRLWQRSPN